MPTPDTYYVHVSSEAHVRELTEAPEDKLSLHAVSRDMLQPKYTMYGLEVKDRMSANGSIHSRVLRTVLTSHLTGLQSTTQKKICAALMDEVSIGTGTGEGWTGIRSFSMAKNIIRTANSTVFFGENLSRDKKFLTAALQYPDDLLITSEVLRFLPSALAPIAAPILMRNSRGSRVLVKHLVPMVKDRLETSLCPDPSSRKSLDCVQWIIDTNPRREPWSPEKIVQVVLGLWFASVHQLAITLVYALDDLCEHGDYIEPLRAGFQRHSEQGESTIDFDQLTLLDSFLKESARLHPSDSISVRRKALSSFTFSDGVRILRDEVACVPLRAIMRDPANYPGGEAFDGFRFVNKGGTGNISKYTDGDVKFPLWGLGRRACPGRYYAVHALKIAVAHIILNYEVKMDDKQKHTSRNFNWRSATVPRSSTTLLFRERQI